AGLAVINFLPPDLAGIAPAVTVVPEYATSRLLAEFDTLFGVGVSATDDVGIREIDLEMDGAIVSSGGGVPFCSNVPKPAKASGRTQVVLRARATDIGGNSTWSAPVTVKLDDDATPPQIASLDPPPGAEIVPGIVSDVSVAFREPIASSISSASLLLSAA